MRYERRPFVLVASADAWSPFGGVLEVSENGNGTLVEVILLEQTQVTPDSMLTRD